MAAHKFLVGATLGGLAIAGTYYFATTDDEDDMETVDCAEDNKRRRSLKSGLRQSKTFVVAPDSLQCDVDSPMIVYSSNKRQFADFDDHIAMDIADKHFPEALHEFLEYFGQRWPPEAAFDKWSDAFSVYLQLCDEVPLRITKMGDIRAFRQWITDTLRRSFTGNNYKKFKDELKAHLKVASRRHDPVLFGLFGCITKLVHSYRWGILPLSPSNLAKHAGNQRVEFPVFLLEPFQILCNFYGVPYCGAAPNLLMATAILERVETADHLFKPIGIRFYWNDIRNDVVAHKTEENAFKLNMFAICGTFPILVAVSESLRFIFRVCDDEGIDLTDTARVDTQRLVSLMNGEYESQYIALLDKVEEAFFGSIKHFGHQFKSDRINHRAYIENVSAPSGWGLGGLGGVSAAQQLISGVVDLFILNAHNRTKFEKGKEGMLMPMVQLLDSLERTVQIRERILPINLLSERIATKFYRIASRIRGFRVVHRNKVFQALSGSNAKQSATGNFKAEISKNGKNGGDPYAGDISKAFYKAMTGIIKGVEKTRAIYKRGDVKRSVFQRSSK